MRLSFYRETAREVNEMEDKLKERRRNYFIDRKFQASFIIKFCLLVTLGTLISAGLVIFLSRSTVTTSFENSRLVIKNTADFIFPAILFSSAIVIAAIGVAAIIVTLYASHKIAGPLYRLGKDIARLKEGDLKTVFQTRQGDQLKGLKDNLNDLSASLKAKVSGLKEGLAQIESALSQARALDEAKTQEFKEKILNLKILLAEFNT